MKPSIYYPVKPFSINQHWGENSPCVKDYGLPTQRIISTGVNACPSGYVKLYEFFGMAGHNGTDLMAGEQPVYAAMAGDIIEMQAVPARGLGVGVLTREKYDFPQGSFYLKLRYWHFKSFQAKVGDYVNVGDILGVSDNTGNSSGNHLHFEGQLFRKDSGGHPSLVTTNDDYANTINIEPYFNGLHAADIRPQRFTKNLYFTLRDPQVLDLQKFLGVYPQTGYFGPITLYYVLKYQVAHAITPTGFVGPITRGSLNKQ